MKRHAEQRGSSVDLFDGAKAEFKTPRQATDFLKLIAAGFSQSGHVLILPRSSTPGEAAFVLKVQAHDEYMIVHQRGDDASLIRIAADELQRLDPGTFEEIRAFFGTCDAPVQSTAPLTPAKDVNKVADGGLQFIAALKNDTITFRPAGFSAASEKAGQETLIKLASAMLGCHIDHRQIPDEIPDLVFIHTPTPYYVVLMPEPTEGLMLGIGPWSALESEIPEVATELQRMIQTATTGSSTQH